MDEFILDLKDVNNEESCNNTVDIFIDSVQDESGFKKQIAKDFFQKCLNNLDNPSASPQLKYYTVMMLKQLSFKDKISLKILSALAPHKLYTFLEDQALTIDPKKSISEKGKTLFPQDKDIGNAYIRLILEAFCYWGQKFPTTSNKEPTRFKKTLNRLNDTKVILPKEWIYFPSLGSKEKESKESAVVSQKSKTSQSQLKETPGGPKSKEAKEKFVAELKYLYNKIENLLGIFEGSDSPDDIEREIQSHHAKFQKDLQKTRESGGQYIDDQSEDIVMLYFKVSEFLVREERLYKDFSSKNDIASYINGYSIAFEEIFEAEEQNAKENPAIKKEDKQKSSLPPQPQKSQAKPSGEKISKTDSNSMQVSRQNPASTSIIQKNIKPNSKMSNALMDSNINAAVQACFSRLETQSKSPLGFRAVKESLEKEKKSVLASSSLKKRAGQPHGSSFGKSKFGASSMNKSNLNLRGIFASPPNPNVSPKAYEGELVVESLDLEKALYDMKRQQGHRRFKAANLRDKYVLYQNDIIQIGFKSDQIYEQIDKFDSLIEFQVFFGNKTDKKIENISIFFQGDKNSLIYTNPKTIEETIYPNMQIKLDIMVVPKTIPFNLINMKFSYSYNESMIHSSTIIPNSILKLATYLRIEKNNFAFTWKECEKKIKSEPFKLSRHFPPNNISHYIKELNEGSSYIDFAEEGSITDYELFCEVILKELYQGILKIVIRPDLQVVIQVGLLQNNEEAERHFRFFVQSLQLVLKEMDL